MINIIVADDHPVVREGVIKILNEIPDVNVLEQAENGEDAIIKCRKHRPDILILDVTMPGPGFLEIIKRVHLVIPELKVLVLSIHPEEHYALRAIKGGAAGYLTKERSGSELANAVRTIYAGNKYITVTLAQKIVEGITLDQPEIKHELLSNREFEVMRLLGSGKGITEIASLLSLSPKTISTHRTRLFKKMGFNSDADLVRYTMEYKLID